MKSANSTIPPGVGQPWESSLRLLNAAVHSQIPPVVAGFDGFVDTILHVVSERRSPTGIPVSYIGSLGWPRPHPVFDDFTKRVKTYSIGEPGYSDAIEFTDGKLICGRQQSVSEISWQSVLNGLLLDKLSELVRQAGLIAFLDWGIIFSMTEIMNEFLHQLGDHLSGPRKPIFIDTADPAKRSETDIRRFVEILPRLADKSKSISDSTCARALSLPGRLV
jgi:hypothetical protein